MGCAGSAKPGVYTYGKVVCDETGARTIKPVTKIRGGDAKNPISVKVLRGGCPLETVLSDVLGLTKINFNSCLHNDRLPVTIRFASAVGDLLTMWTPSSRRRRPPRGWPSRNVLISLGQFGAGEGIRTLDPNLGKVKLSPFRGIPRYSLRCILNAKSNT